MYSEGISKILSSHCTTMANPKQISAENMAYEHQKVFVQDKQTYDDWLTSGIIFRLEDNTEISLEKNVWFSEMITVDKGSNLLNKFTPASEFAEDW